MRGGSSSNRSYRRSRVFGRSYRKRRDYYGSGGAETGFHRLVGQNIADKTEKLGLLYWLGRRHLRVATVKAVKYFQSKNGLAVDGIVGAKTAAALGMTLSGSSSGSSSGSYSSSDEYLLAKCVYAEARGEPYVGQVAVAAVVLNRVRSASFPNTIAGVIYQPWAFTCVNDGQINLSPDNNAIKAAKDALNGWDPTNGCLYYYNPATATSSWIWSRPVMLSIGKHNFAK